MPSGLDGPLLTQPPLVDGAVYTVTFEGVDAAGKGEDDGEERVVEERDVEERDGEKRVGEDVDGGVEERVVEQKDGEDN